MIGLSVKSLEVNLLELLPSSGQIYNSTWTTTGGSVSNTTTLLWQSQDWTDGWKKASITYETSHYHYIVFKVMPDREQILNTGYVALDNIDVTEESCFGKYTF